MIRLTDRQLQQIVEKAVGIAEKHPTDEFMQGLITWMRKNKSMMDDSDRQQIDDAFENEMPVLRKSCKAYRGMWLDSLDDLYPQTDFWHRDVISFGDYVSVSTNRDIADFYLFRPLFHPEGNSASVAISFNIHTKQGAREVVPADYLQQIADMHPDDDMMLQNAEYEGEIILHKSAEFKVVQWKDDPESNVQMGRDPATEKFYEVHLEQVA